MKFRFRPSKMIPVGIGVVLSVMLVAGGYMILQSAASRAEDQIPRDIIISSITENSVKITWNTGTETQGVVEYGTTPAALSFFAPEAVKTTLHDVELTLLSPATTYYFQIRVADTVHDNGGVPWTFTTKSTGVTLEEFNTAQPEPTSAQEPSFTTSPTCNETDCEQIRQRFFDGCDTQDYIRCLKAREAAGQ